MSDATFGYGQAGLNDTSHPYNVMRFIFARLMAQNATMKIVQVKAVHGPSSIPGIAGTVDVQPLVDQVDGNGNATPHGTVYGLPYLRLQGGKNAVVLEPVVDDIGLCVVSDRDISAVKTKKGRATPGSFRKFDLADGVYIGGILNAEPDQYVAITADGIVLKDKHGNKMETTSSGIAFTATRVTCNGAIIAGFGGADQVGLQTHLHTSGGSGSPTTAPTAGT